MKKAQIFNRKYKWKIRLSEILSEKLCSIIFLSKSFTL